MLLQLPTVYPTIGVMTSSTSLTSVVPAGKGQSSCHLGWRERTLAHAGQRAYTAATRGQELQGVCQAWASCRARRRKNACFPGRGTTQHTSMSVQEPANPGGVPRGAPCAGQGRLWQQLPAAHKWAKYCSTTGWRRFVIWDAGRTHHHLR